MPASHPHATRALPKPPPPHGRPRARFGPPLLALSATLLLIPFGLWSADLHRRRDAAAVEAACAAIGARAVPERRPTSCVPPDGSRAAPWR